MKNLICKTAVIVMLLFNTGAIHAADLKDGFMGLQWRTDLSASPEFVKIDEQNGVQNFIRPSVVHSVGDTNIFPVIYSSFGNEFFAAYFEKDILIFGRLRNFFNQEFGPSTTTTRLNPRRTTDIWNYRDTKIKIEVNRETGELKLSVYYTPLSAKVNELQLEAYQQNTRRFLDRIDKDRAIEKFDMINSRRW
jgi:hypothetical protein